MDLNSTSCTSDDFVFRIRYDVHQCRAGWLKNGWNGGILFHDYNQGLSGYRSKWPGEGEGVWDWVCARVSVRVANGLGYGTGLGQG